MVYVHSVSQVTNVKVNVAGAVSVNVDDEAT